MNIIPRMSDTDILNWLDSWHTLHHTVEALYVVDGYEVSIIRDGNLYAGPYKGKTLREAYKRASINVYKNSNE